MGDTSTDLINEAENKNDVKTEVTEENNNAPDDIPTKEPTTNEVKDTTPKDTEPETIVNDISTEVAIPEHPTPQDNSEPETNTMEKQATNLVNASDVENKDEVGQNDQTEAPKDSETVKIIEKKETSNVTKTDDVPLETNIKEEPTSAVKAEIVAVEPATKEPAAKQPVEIAVETLITAETEVTKDQTEAPKNSETIKIIEKKETSNVTKTDDVPSETNIKEEPTSAVKAKIVAVEPATKEPAAKQP